jgi:hypothetical protein
MIGAKGLPMQRSPIGSGAASSCKDKLTLIQFGGPPQYNGGAE